VIILDLALQGILDLAGSTRVRLQSGYGALVSPRIEPNTLIKGLQELLCSTGYDPSVAGLAAPGAKTIGGGVTVMDAGGATFRVMRDFLVGTGQLLEFNRESKTFAEISNHPGEIAQTLRARAGLPGRVIFDAVFVLTPENLPSQASIPSVASEPEIPEIDLEALKTRLAEIEGALAAQQQIEDAEFELDGVQKQRFGIEDRIKTLSFDDTELQETDAEAARIRYLDVLPDDFAHTLGEYEMMVARRDADLKRWREERDGIDRTERITDVDPLLRDWRLWLGLGVGLAAIGVAVVGAAFIGDALRWAALGDIPAFGLTAFVLFQNLSQREARGHAKLRVDLSDKRRERIVSRDGEAIGHVERLLKQVQIENPDEARRALAMRQKVRQRIAHLEQQKEAALKNPLLADLKKQHAELTAKVDAIDGRLVTMTAVPIDGLAMRAEADHLRVQIAELEPDPEPENAQIEVPAPVGPMGASWMMGALDLLLTDPASAAKMLSERASLLIRALSGNQLVGVSVYGNGLVALKTAQGGVAEWDLMPQAAQDIAYLALRGGLFLAIDQRQRSPMISGDIGGRLANGQQLTQTLFTTLAHGGQVIHIVRRADQAPGAKHTTQVEVR